jgi:hypothetical protein
MPTVGLTALQRRDTLCLPAFFIAERTTMKKGCIDSIIGMEVIASVAGGQQLTKRNTR